MSTATETKFTSGPWRFWSDRDGSDPSVLGKDDIAICHLDDENGSREVNERDGRLIAAAPELLAAAEVAELHFRRNHSSGKWQGDDEHEAWTALRAAIAKAEGTR